MGFFVCVCVAVLFALKSTEEKGEKKKLRWMRLRIVQGFQIFYLLLIVHPITLRLSGAVRFTTISS